MTARRKYLTKNEKTTLLAKQHNLCHECGEPFTKEDPPDYDHHLAIIDGGRGKPDRAIHRIKCHKPKSVREHKANAKVKRIRKKATKKGRKSKKTIRGLSFAQQKKRQAAWLKKKEKKDAKSRD